eukprot:CAMPEP_0174851352 /NCGR_PEP_ID=MMETSP1114-20130205/23099_1 /TAXON_ID=312471 /ORGANISM="Neobodo designis, Strain CCAP 1951/1" /LENGTH=186 /DNA_ID=CAMNT_0016085887 /DNA_START=48 /DNA_END=604 /DNA_ORIENTATION=+
MAEFQPPFLPTYAVAGPAHVAPSVIDPRQLPFHHQHQPHHLAPLAHPGPFAYHHQHFAGFHAEAPSPHPYLYGDLPSPSVHASPAGPHAAAGCRPVAPAATPFPAGGFPMSAPPPVPMMGPVGFRGVLLSPNAPFLSDSGENAPNPASPSVRETSSETSSGAAAAVTTQQALKKAPPEMPALPANP